MSKLTNMYAKIANEKFYECISKFEYFLSKDDGRDFSSKELKEFIEDFGLDIYCEEVIIEFANVGLKQISENPSRKNIAKHEVVLHLISLVISTYSLNHPETISDEFKQVANDVCKSALTMIMIGNILI